MRRFVIIFLLIFLLVQPVQALDITAPTAPAAANKYMPVQATSFWKDILYVIQETIDEVRPQLSEAIDVCVGIFAMVLLSSMIHSVSDGAKQAVVLVAIVLISIRLLRSTHSMISLANDTIFELTQYGKLLLPVLAGALASQGAAASSTALYAGTAMFSSLLSSMISKLLVPMVYVFLCLGIANAALADAVLSRLRDFVKWLITWSLKLILYVFLGYMSISSVISGTVDASAMKTTKLAISSFVPVIGNILSDASETILVSASVMKNTAGIYGLVVLSAILISPFIRIGVHYILLKVTGTICEIFSVKEISQLIIDFSATMGFMLAMTGIACLLLMISIVCIMKGAT